MSVGRLALVVASQCEALQQLTFLPPGGAAVLPALSESQRLAFRLRDLLVDPERGGFEPVDVDGVTASGLLINPTQPVADAVLQAALGVAHKRSATLLVHFVGHGSGFLRDPADRPRHLLHVWDTVAKPIDAEPESRGWDPYALVDRRRPYCRGIAGLMLLVDACRASWAETQVQAWEGVEGGLVSAWLAASGDEAAWDACLTRTLVAVLENGIPADQHPRGALLPEVAATDLELVSEERCKSQKPRLGGYQSHNPVLYVGRNKQADAMGDSLGLSETDRALVLRLVADYVDVPVVAAVESAVTASRVVALVGGPGTGKSTLAAALLSPPTHAAEVSFGLVQAGAFVSTAATLPEFARVLNAQLSRLPGFAEAATRYRATNLTQWGLLSPWEQLVTGPLRAFRQQVRLLVDGLDQIADRPQYREIERALADIVDDANLAHVSLLLCGRSAPDITTAEPVSVPDLQESAAVAYLSRRGIPPERHPSLVTLADHNWLLLRLLADVETGRERTTRDEGWAGVYRSLLAGPQERYGKLAEALLAVLAAVGVGPTLPFDLLAAAAFDLAEADGHQASVVEILGDPDLYPLIDRARPSSPEERLGLFHQTLAVHVQAHSTFEAVQVHRALVTAIDRLAPSLHHNRGSYRQHPLLAYAFDAGPRHRREANDLQSLVADLDARRDLAPRVNLARWITWTPVLREVLGGASTHSLCARLRMAHWIGETGEASHARDALDNLLPDMVRVLGDKDPETLTTKAELAKWAGHAGDFAAARDILRQLLPQRVAVLGAKHPKTLITRRELAEWTGQSSEDDEGATLTRDELSQLLRDMENVFGEHDPETVSTRLSLAYWTGRAGDAAGARDMLARLVLDLECTAGADDGQALAARYGLARWTATAGDAAEALEMYSAMLPAYTRIYGPKHPDTLRLRLGIAWNTYQTGDASGASVIYSDLLPDLVRVLGPEHPDTMKARFIAASEAWNSGDSAGARDQFAELAQIQERALGVDHPDTLKTRSNLATCTAQAGDATTALDVFAQLLPQMERVLGPADKSTLIARSVRAAMTGRVGDAAGARDQFAELAQIQGRALGVDHPDTLQTRLGLARFTAVAGDAARARDMLERLLPDMDKVLGPGHSDTLAAREDLEAL